MGHSEQGSKGPYSGCPPNGGPGDTHSFESKRGESKSAQKRLISGPERRLGISYLAINIPTGKKNESEVLKILRAEISGQGHLTNRCLVLLLPDMLNLIELKVSCLPKSPTKNKASFKGYLFWR